ncbi:Asp23/Gls24 family envelope stress response protein [Streptomyces sp. NPDC002764]|uniref:Asp23/Gls24 family envelope stress response protein n=1 Tax=Streptomyces sp. NPDC002764 TaxID=3154428 RepID=UPI0033263C5D
MTTQTPQTALTAKDVSTPRTGGAQTRTTAVSGGVTGADQLAADRGRTSIADVVVVKVAGTAAREIPGVHDMGGGLSRTIGAVRDRVPGGRPNIGRGVKVEVGERQTAIDLDLVVEYGVAITDVSRDVRENVISAVERITGLDVVEVNITVNDVRLPEEEESETTAAARVE